MSEPFLGQITLYPYAFPPIGWADCAGQLLPIRQYTALFSLLGTTFGGDGVTSFGLPDLRGRAGVGAGALPGGTTYALGDKAGADAVALTQDQTARHYHALAATSSLGVVNTPGGGLLSQVAKGTLQGRDKGNIYSPGTPNAQLTGSMVVPAGSQQPHNNMQPSLALRYCIALSGTIPQRP